MRCAEWFSQDVFCRPAICAKASTEFEVEIVQNGEVKKVRRDPIDELLLELENGDAECAKVDIELVYDGIAGISQLPQKDVAYSEDNGNHKGKSLYARRNVNSSKDNDTTCGKDSNLHIDTFICNERSSARDVHTFSQTPSSARDVDSFSQTLNDFEPRCSTPPMDSQQEGTPGSVKAEKELRQEHRRSASNRERVASVDTLSPRDVSSPLYKEISAHTGSRSNSPTLLTNLRKHSAKHKLNSKRASSQEDDCSARCSVKVLDVDAFMRQHSRSTLHVDVFDSTGTHSEPCSPFLKGTHSDPCSPFVNQLRRRKDRDREQHWQRTCLDCMIVLGDVLAVANTSRITQIGATGGMFGHVLLSTGVPRCIRKGSLESSGFLNIWPQHGVHEIYQVPVIESSRSTSGIHETDLLLYVDPKRGKILILGEVDGNGTILAYEPEEPEAVELWQCPEELRDPCCRDLKEAVLDEMKQNQANWSWSTAVRAFALTAAAGRARSKEATRSLHLMEVQNCWQTDPICTSLPIIFWQRYLCKLGESGRVSEGPLCTMSPYDMIMKYMPLMADRALPGELFKLMFSSGWTNVQQLPIQGNKAKPARPRRNSLS